MRKYGERHRLAQPNLCECEIEVIIMKSTRLMNNTRPVFPKRAIVTGGMPYGNKSLHFGHIGGMFIHADVFARFLRDRIGKENVIFVSGTDCYGSPILESYRKLKAEGYKGSMEDYVRSNHELQKTTLEKYGISLNLFGTSAFGESGRVHDGVSADIFNKLYENGHLDKMSTPQFYDDELGVFLNGRQVIGKCPIEGCQSDKAYAEECALGHQYMPEELVDPVSALSGKKPSLVGVTNWYFRMDKCTDMMRSYLDMLKKETNTRKHQLITIEEFLKDPELYVPRKYISYGKSGNKNTKEELEALEVQLPEHITIDEEKKPAVTFIFKDLEHRDAAKKVLDSLGMHYTSGKTLVPFRLSGNISWGVKVPDKDDLTGLTFWVWPESLWAPVSFTKAYLASIGADENEWLKFWNDEDSMVYQFIGEDNLSFYGIAEMAMLVSLMYKKGEEYDLSKVHFPHIVANRHVLFMEKKVSSSSDIKPPMADDLLEFYSPLQLRMHFLGLGLSQKSASFTPQVYLPEDERAGADPVLKDGNLLTNVFNRLVRSCFYSVQTHTDGKIPKGEVSEKIKKLAEEAMLNYEKHMYNHDFHRIAYTLDEFIRELNKHWVNNIRIADKEDNDELRKQIYIDSFYAVKVCTILLHPIAPEGCEMVREYLNIDERMWNWDYILEPVEFYTGDLDKHELKFLEAKVDFFKKPEWQFNTENQ